MSTKEHHVLWDTTHKYKVAQKNNVSGNSTEINAAVAQLKSRMYSLLISGSM
jgi:hypothetical protein